MKQMLCIGCYTPAPQGDREVSQQGHGHGVQLCAFEDGQIESLSTLPMINPSYLCIRPQGDKMYAVSEITYKGSAPGGMIAQIGLRRDGSLALENLLPTGGCDPCHAALSPDGRWLSVANYTDGKVSLFRCSPSGDLGHPQIFQLEGCGPNPDRQSSAHAHSTLFAPDGHTFYVADLGSDRLAAFYYNSTEVCRRESDDCLLPPGRGPRHMQWGRNGTLYVVNELFSTVCCYRVTGGQFALVQELSTLPADFTGPSAAADLHSSLDGQFLYASNRGHNSIIAYKIRGDGSLSVLDWFPCRGETPRSFAIDPAGCYLLAANQDSDAITIFAIASDGCLQFRGQYPCGSPSCLQFVV